MEFKINGKQRTLPETANALLKHDPDLIYFGELRTRSDFETATSIALRYEFEIVK